LLSLLNVQQLKQMNTKYYLHLLTDRLFWGEITRFKCSSSRSELSNNY